MDNKGEKNPNYKHGRYVKNCCEICKKEIDPRSKMCYKCRAKYNNSFKGKKHTETTKEKIGIKSAEKFTEEFKEKVYRKRLRGTKWISQYGYMYVKDYDHPNRNKHNQVFEHIKIMSEHLKRPIDKGEIIHHINMDKTDNRLENLYLYTNRKEHQEGHHSLNTLAKELLEKGIVKFKNGKYELTEEIK